MAAKSSGLPMRELVLAKASIGIPREDCASSMGQTAEQRMVEVPPSSKSILDSKVKTKREPMGFIKALWRKIALLGSKRQSWEDGRRLEGEIQGFKNQKIWVNRLCKAAQFLLGRVEKP